MDTATTASQRSTGQPGGWWAWLFGIPLTALFLLAGLWLFAGVLAPGYDTSILFGIGWFVALSVVLGKLTKGRRDLRPFTRGAFLLTAVTVSAIAAWTTFRDETVNEQIVTAAPAPAAQQPAAREDTAAAADGTPEPDRKQNVLLASGGFKPLTHGPAAGKARVIELPDGRRKLTLSDGFSVDNGPDLRVYLVAGDPTADDQVRDYVDLGGLKGNKGNQQYEIARDTDVKRYDTVYIWCRAFTVGFARAPLA